MHYLFKTTLGITPFKTEDTEPYQGLLKTGSVGLLLLLLLFLRKALYEIPQTVVPHC